MGHEIRAHVAYFSVPRYRTVYLKDPTLPENSKADDLDGAAPTNLRTRGLIRALPVLTAFLSNGAQS